MSDSDVRYPPNPLTIFDLLAHPKISRILIQAPEELGIEEHEGIDEAFRNTPLFQSFYASFGREVAEPFIKTAGVSEDFSVLDYTGITTWANQYLALLRADNRLSIQVFLRDVYRQISDEMGAVVIRGEIRPDAQFVASLRQVGLDRMKAQLDQLITLNQAIQVTEAGKLP